MTNNTAMLASIFQNVTKALVNNQQVLNQADEQNHDHGTNMVQTFQSITNSLENKQASTGSEALAFAAQQLSKQATSGSGKLYAQNLATAANQFKGQNVDPKAAIQLLQTLIGGGQQSQEAVTQPAGNDLLSSILGGLAGTGQNNQTQPAAQSSGGDLLGSILGELAGSGQAQPAQQTAQPAGDLLGSLLGELTGAGNPPDTTSGALASSNGLDVGDLINAGMTFMQAKQSGGTNASALIQAVVAGSGMGNSNHRTQSTQLVANSFLQALGALAGKS